MKKVIFLALLLSACTDLEVTRGAELRQEKIDKITQQSVKGDVLNLLGSPSSKSTFGEETWYYITNTRERNIIGADEVLNQEVLAVAFNADETVKDVKLYTKDNAQEIEFSDKSTPTAGHKLTVLEQMLGNIGKFNKDDADARAKSRGSVPGR